MAKFCTNCGNELAENAAICVNCGQVVSTGASESNGGKKKKKGLPVWAIVLIVVGCVVLLPIIIFVGIAVFAFNNIDDETKNNIDNIINENNKVLTGTIGDTLTTDDYKLTLTSALMYSEIKGEYYTDTPASGKEYLVFYFNVENISDENEYISSYNFSGYVDDTAVSTKYLLNNINGVEELASDLAPGKKASGFVAFEVDTSWQDFEIHFAENSWEDTSMIFRVVNEDKSSNQDA